MSDKNGDVRNRSNGKANGDIDVPPADYDKPQEDSTTLQRNVGLIGGISFIVGTMIGSGIFVSPKGVLRGAGSTGLSLIVWALAGIVSMFGAISYVELGGMITKSGAEYVYLLEAFHPVIAYLFSFVSTLLLKPSSCAIISLTCAEYVMTLFFDDGCGSPPGLNNKLLAVTVMILIASINILSVKAATSVQIVFTVAKLIALVIIIIGGIVRLGQGYTENLSFDGDGASFGSVAIGFYSAMWAYDGWNNLNYIIEELRDPEKNLPRAILIGIPLVTIVYVLTNISYFTVLTPEELLDSPAVAKSWAEGIIPQFAWIMPLFVALSTFGAANGSLFTSGRLVFVAAREGHMLKILSFINVNRYSPAPAVMFTVLIAAIMLIPSDIESLIDFFSFAAWMFYFLVFVGLVYMRWRYPDGHEMDDGRTVYRPYRVPLIFPILGAIFALFLVIAPIVDEPKVEYLYAFMFIIGGLIFYFPFVFFKLELPCMKQMNCGLQLFLQVAPGEDPDEKPDTDAYTDDKTSPADNEIRKNYYNTGYTPHDAHDDYSTPKTDSYNPPMYTDTNVTTKDEQMSSTAL